MASFRQNALIEAPISAVWELVANPNRHAEWFPHIVEAHCDGIEQGCTFKQVTRKPWGVRMETTIYVEKLDDCREVHIRCLDTGTSSRWLLTEAQGATFVEFEFGQDPQRPLDRALDRLGARRYFRRWGEQALDALRAALTARQPGAERT
jgi:uncharacterized protein YndB with AHSA1/START domain